MSCKRSEWLERKLGAANPAHPLVSQWHLTTKLKPHPQLNGKWSKCTLRTNSVDLIYFPKMQFSFTYWQSLFFFQQFAFDSHCCQQGRRGITKCSKHSFAYFVCGYSCANYLYAGLNDGQQGQFEGFFFFLQFLCTSPAGGEHKCRHKLWQPHCELISGTATLIFTSPSSILSNRR